MHRVSSSSSVSPRLVRSWWWLVVPAVLIAGVSLLLSLRQYGPVIGGPTPMPPETYLPSPPGITVESIATGLEIVWSLQFAPDGRLFVTERPGRIRVLSPDGRLDAQPWKTPDNVHHVQEAGLMGLALHPRFPQEPWVYVMYTAQTKRGSFNRVSRFREANGRGGEEQVLLDGLVAPGEHNGGRIRFGPDGMLYVGTGDAWDPNRSQNLHDRAGKILRLTPDGKVPVDNPWPGSPVWALGFRNVPALAWHPRTGALFAAEHGPSGEIEFAKLGEEPKAVYFLDRLSVVKKGGNYGWPDVIGSAGPREYFEHLFFRLRPPRAIWFLRPPPLLVFSPSAPPGDLLFYNADLMPGFRGDLFYSVLGFRAQGAQTLMRIRFGDATNPHRPTAIERWFNEESGNAVYGRLRAMTVGQDGALYVGTSNRDGRELSKGPRLGDDRILRIAPTGQ
jgi:glucose/arabinose dehydrogenase